MISERPVGATASSRTSIGNQYSKLTPLGDFVSQGKLGFCYRSINSGSMLEQVYQFFGIRYFFLALIVISSLSQQ